MADAALAWLLHQPAVVSVLVGASRPEQIMQNVRAASIRLDRQAIQKLAAATEVVKESLGSNCDLRQAAARVR